MTQERNNMAGNNNNTRIYIPTVVVICVIVFAAMQGIPMLQKKLNAERKIYVDEHTALEAARSTESLLNLQAINAIKLNDPFAKFNKEWVDMTSNYHKAEDAQRLIVLEAQKAGLKIGRSKLLEKKEYNTLEGTVQARQFEINVEGTHQQIGSWMARCEALIRTLRPVVTDWYPYGTVVQANVAFQLLDDVDIITASEKGIPSYGGNN